MSRLSKNKQERKEMFKSLIISLCRDETKHLILYTARSKVFKNYFERIIHKTKQKTERREALRYLCSKVTHNAALVLNKINTLKNRNGGYLSVRKYDIDKSNQEKSIICFSDIANIIYPKKVKKQ